MSNVSNTLWRAYQEVPQQVALTLLDSQTADQHYTYRELVERAVGYTQSLTDAGIRPGEVVILILQHGIDLAAAFFGSVLHGAIPSIMPFLTEKLSSEHYRQSLQALFEITSPAAIITYPQFLDEVNIAAQESVSVRSVLASDQVNPLSNPSENALPGLKQPLEAIVLLQHSSGTTGLQKGVALSHQAILNQLESYSLALQLSQDDVIVSWLPLYHDMGLIAGFILPVLRQIHLVLMSPFDWVRSPAKLMKAISQYRGTLAWLPNFAYNFCAQKIRPRDLQDVDLSSWRAVINCSEPMHWQSHQMFLDCYQPLGLRPSALATCYAMAENVFAVTQGGIDEPVTVDLVDGYALTTRQIAEPWQEETTMPSQPLRMLSAGRPIPNTLVRIIDDHGNEVPERYLGEIALQSNCMLTGYYHRPDLTEKAFLDGWYLTGDLGYMANGELYITGRKKDLIIVGGKNIYPQDLERLASEISGIHPGRVVAFGISDEVAGTEEVVIVAELDDYEYFSEDEREQIAQQVRRKITRGSEITLRYVYLVKRNWLLKTSSGKMARSSNREKYLAETYGFQQ